MIGQPTIRDVARQCGCSVYTVSSVLNNKGRISQATRQRVREIARKLNYDPLKNMPLARRVTAKTLAIVVPSTQAEINPFFWVAISTARQAAAAGNHDFKLFTLDDLVQQVSNSPGSPVTLGFDALIVFCCDPPKVCIRRIMDKGIAVALVRRQVDLPGTISVLDDDATSMRVMLEHLHQHHGHTRIAVLADQWKSSSPNTRLDALRAYVNAHGLKHNDELILDRDSLGQSMHAKLAQLVAARRFTALFCMSDEMAVEVAIHLMRRGVRIPDDLALVGYSNTRSARNFFPTITSVNVPVDHMVAAAAKNVLNYDPDLAGQSTVIRFENHLVVRESCGCRIPADPDA